MDPMEGNGARSPLQAAKEPLSLRFLLAFSASTVLTAAVAVPMAFQAHLAREDGVPAERERPAVVLGTTTVPAPVEPGPLSGEGLFATTATSERAALQGAEVSGDFDLTLELPGTDREVERVDFVLDDGEVETDRSEPWQPFDDDGGRPIEAGEHTLTATVTFADGHVEVRRASFTVIAG